MEKEEKPMDPEDETEFGDNGKMADDDENGTVHARNQSAEEDHKKEILYLKAEFENYKKRMLRDQDQAIRFANEKLIREILSVSDLFDRGMAHGKSVKAKHPDPELANFISGIEMTQQQLTQLLSRFGVEFIGTVGEKFDPGKHEAIAQREAPAEQNDTVLEVFQKGCLLHGRLLAPAKVVVGKSA